jgi:probable O-glycosylation ligase (exosortase A-associated)
MRDLFFVGFLAALLGLGLRRPFILVLAYVYVDIVSPQRLTYLLLNSVPVSLICVVMAVGAWAVFDEKKDVRAAPRQFFLFLLLIYCGVTTLQADFPLEAQDKWAWVWKSLAFAIFLPLTLRTRLRIESLALFMVFSAASIIVVGGIKTLASGGGYGVLNLMVTNNSGLYESSTIATVAIAIIPIILWLMRHNTLFPEARLAKLYGSGLIFACLLMPIGTQARTGLICIALLAVMLLRSTQRRLLYLTAIGVIAAAAIPFLPSSFSNRMDTIKGYKGDASASTRIAVWQWTWDYVKDHPWGGGFDAYKQNRLRIELENESQAAPGQQDVTQVVAYDQARAYHSAYFEMLGEQGYAGLALWCLIHFGGLIRMEILRSRYRKDQDKRWISDLANALQQAHAIYLVGSLFVGIAFQPFVYMLVGMQIGLDTYAGRRSREEKQRPTFGQNLGQTLAKSPDRVVI